MVITMFKKKNHGMLCYCDVCRSRRKRSFLYNIVTSIILIICIYQLFIIFLALCKFIFGDDMEIEFNFKIAVIVAVIATTIVILTPDEKTMLSMLTLSFITPDNIVITENHIVDLITKIMDAVNNK